MFHKGLTFPKRNAPSKAYKDLYGIWYAATQLGEFSDKAVAELALLSQQHSKWFKTFQKNLHQWMENAAPIDWSRLEAQDPSGRLKKLNFEKIIKSIISRKENQKS